MTNTGPFPSELIIRAQKPAELRWVAGNTQLYEVHEQPFVYQSLKYGRVEVPVGTLTDFASIPGLVHGLIDSDDKRIALPSVVHDYLYAIEGALPDGRTFTREQADDMLREGMLACGAGAVIANVVFAAVRVTGWASWGK